MGYPWKSLDKLFAVDLNAAIANAVGVPLFAATGTSVLRSMSARAADWLNVKDYGALLDGVTNDATALNLARAAAINNQTIIVPAGGLHKTANPTSGPNSVYWKLDGNCFDTGTQPISAIGSADVLETVLGGKFLARSSTNANNQAPILRLDSTTTYNGYTAGFVSSALKINMTASAGNNAYSWASNIILNANSTGGANNNQDVGSAVTVRRAGSSATWQYFGATTDMTGLAPNSVSSIVAGEFDISCNGPEVSSTNYAPGSGSRVGFNFPVSTYLPPSWTASTAYTSVIPYSVVQPTSPNGFVYICTQSGTTGLSQPTFPVIVGNTVTDGTVVWTCGTTLNTQVSRMLNLGSGTGVSIGTGLYCAQDYYNAVIDMSYSTLTATNSSAPAAIRLAAGMPIDFSGNQTLAGQNLHKLLYNSGSTRLQYVVSGSEAFGVNDSGSFTANAFTSVGSGAITAGSGSSNHITLSPAATGSTPSITGTGDGGLSLAAQNNKSIKILGGGSVWSGADVTGFQSSLTGTGTSTSTAPFFNRIDVTESLDRSITTSTPVTAFNIFHNYGGGTTKGGRIAQNIQLLQTAANTDTADNFYVGQAIYMFGRYAAPGSTVAAPLGRLFGLNVNSTIQAGFTALNYYQVAGCEIDVTISTGSTSWIRSGLSICDLGGANVSSAAQGTRVDNAIWLYNGGTGIGWRYGICFGDMQGWGMDTSVGTMFGAKYGSGKNAGANAAMWGIDLQQVLFPSTGNSYDGGSFRSKNFAIDGLGVVQIGSTYLTPSTSGLAIDPKGSVGASAAIQTAGTGYELGTLVVTAYGGVWSVATNGSGVPTGAVTVITQPVYPSTTPPSNPVTVVNQNLATTGSGLTINITWTTNATTLALSPSAGATTVGGTLTATGGNSTLLQVVSNTISSTVNTSAILFKNGPAGSIMLRVGGSANTIECDTNIVLTAGTWGAGALINNTSPIFQNASFAGSTSSTTASFGAFLQQTDNSTNSANGIGFSEHLILNGSSVVGPRGAGSFILDINAITGNAVGKQYTALLSKSNLMVTDAGSGGVYSTAFGFNSVAHIGTGVTANACCGAEINTWVEGTVTLQDRIGMQIVDVTGSTFGTQGTRDDVALSFNNQYGASSSLGFKVGLGFGRAGGNFPVATNGTLIYGQGNAGASWTVAKGIDWNLGTATGNWLNMGGLFLVDGSGNATAATYKVGSNQVVGARITGWGSAINGAKTAFNGSTATLAATSAAVAQLIADLTTHGVIGT